MGGEQLLGPRVTGPAAGPGTRDLPPGLAAASGAAAAAPCAAALTMLQGACACPCHAWQPPAGRAGQAGRGPGQAGQHPDTLHEWEGVLRPAGCRRASIHTGKTCPHGTRRLTYSSRTHTFFPCATKPNSHPQPTGVNNAPECLHTAHTVSMVWFLLASSLISTPGCRSCPCLGSRCTATRRGLPHPA